LPATRTLTHRPPGGTTVVEAALSQELNEPPGIKNGIPDAAARNVCNSTCPRRC